MKLVQIVGMGCPKCKVTHSQVRRAAEILGISIHLETVDSAQEIARLGVISTPAVLIDGKLAFSGKVPSIAELKHWLNAR